MGGAHGLDKMPKTNETAEIFRSNSPTLIADIKTHFEQNKDTIILDTVYPLIDDHDFIDVVIKNKIGFTSVDDPDLAAKFNACLQFVASKNHGNPNGGQNMIIPANKFAKKMGPILDELDEAGFKTFRAKANELNRKKIKTLRGKKWNPSTVRLTHLRWQDLNEPKKETSSKDDHPRPQ